MNVRTSYGQVRRKFSALVTVIAIVSTAFVATASPVAAACDYSDAAQNSGWGWDPETRTSCAPESRTTPVVDNCDYSAAEQNSGWGWDPVTRQSCPPVSDIDVIGRRIDASGRRAIVSETSDGDLRIVHVDESGETTVIQFEPGSAGYELSTWHFEERSALNTGLPETLDDALGSNHWTLLPASQSVFHQDPGVAGTEFKFIHDDGREAVYYNDGRLVTDPEYAGTFNYVNPRPGPENLLDIKGAIAFAIYGLGHLIVDVIPYAFGGNTRDADPSPAPLGTPSPLDESDLDNRDDDDDGIPAGQDLDDKDPNRGARPGTPYADDDGDGIVNYLDDFPEDGTEWAEDPCEGSQSNAASCGNTGGGNTNNGGGGNNGGSVQTSSGGSVQTSSGGTVQIGR